MIKIGERLPQEIMYESDEYRMTSSGSMEAMFRTTINGINYIFCKNQTDTITYIETKDENFVTKEGFKVGMRYYDEIANKTEQKLQLEKGWAYVLPLDDGWYAAFDLSEVDLQKMSTDSTIKWFYKRK